VSRDPIMLSSLRRRMVDEAMDGYVEWREECVRVWDAYHRWLSAVRPDAALASRAYVAALDREERAAQVYAGLISRLDRLVGTSRRRATQDRAPASGASQQ
jgi:hypothetical protein